MIMYMKEFCTRCKKYKRFRWKKDNTYECPICGKTLTTDGMTTQKDFIQKQILYIQFIYHFSKKKKFIKVKK